MRLEAFLFQIFMVWTKLAAETKKKKKQIREELKKSKRAGAQAQPAATA